MSIPRKIFLEIKNKSDELKSRTIFSANLLRKTIEANTQKTLKDALKFRYKYFKDIILNELPESLRLQALNNPTLFLHYFTFRFNPLVYNKEVKQKIYPSLRFKSYPQPSYDKTPSKVFAGPVYVAPNRVYFIKYNKTKDVLETKIVDTSTAEGRRIIWGSPHKKPKDTLEFETLRGLGKDDLIDLSLNKLPNKYSLVSIFKDKADRGFVYSKNDLRKPIKADKINQTPFLESEAELVNDYVTFYFKSLSNEKICQFRAFIKNFSESTNTVYNTQDYIFNIVKLYSYVSVETTYNISFKLFPFSKDELVKIWEKLSFLKAHLFPARRLSRGGNFVPPILEVTLGNVWKSRRVLLTSLNTSFSEENVWEIEKGKQLPQYIDVDLSLTLIYTNNITTSDFFSKRASMFDYDIEATIEETAETSQTTVDPATGVVVNLNDFRYPQKDSFNAKINRLDVLKLL